VSKPRRPRWSEVWRMRSTARSTAASRRSTPSRSPRSGTVSSASTATDAPSPRSCHGLTHGARRNPSRCARDWTSGACTRARDAASIPPTGPRAFAGSPSATRRRFVECGDGSRSPPISKAVGSGATRNPARRRQPPASSSTKTTGGTPNCVTRAASRPITWDRSSISTTSRAVRRQRSRGAGPRSPARAGYQPQAMAR